MLVNFILLVILIIGSCRLIQNSRSSSINEPFTSTDYKKTTPMRIHFPTPSSYDTELCDILNKLSNPDYDPQDITLNCARAMTKEEFDNIDNYLSEILLTNSLNTNIGRIRLMDLTGYISKGENHSYYEIKGIMYNQDRSFGTPLLGELYYNNNNSTWVIKRLKGPCKQAYKRHTPTATTVVSKFTQNDNDFYPKSLTDKIYNLKKKVVDETKCITVLPGLDNSAPGTFSLTNSYDNPSDVARRFADISN